MFCTVCEKEVETHIRTSVPEWYWKTEHRHAIYKREVCIKCQSPLLIDKIPEFDTKIKYSKRDKENEKIFNQNKYRMMG